MWICKRLMYGSIAMTILTFTLLFRLRYVCLLSTIIYCIIRIPRVTTMGINTLNTSTVQTFTAHRRDNAQWNHKLLTQQLFFNMCVSQHLEFLQHHPLLSVSIRSMLRH